VLLTIGARVRVERKQRVQRPIEEIYLGVDLMEHPAKKTSTTTELSKFSELRDVVKA
jgi:hypothetical protein